MSTWEEWPKQGLILVIKKRPNLSLNKKKQIDKKVKQFSSRRFFTQVSSTEFRDTSK